VDQTTFRTDVDGIASESVRRDQLQDWSQVSFPGGTRPVRSGAP